MSIKYLLLLIILFKDSTPTNIYSFVDNYTAGNIINIQKGIAYVENKYIEFVMPKSAKFDSVCALSYEKKMELCRIVFELPFYKNNFQTYLSKISFSKTSLICIEKELSLIYSEHNLKNKIQKQKMYPCYGKHKIVRTSFIEDDNYDRYYLSDGSDINSVIVYTYIQNKYYGDMFTFDFIYNIDISKLNNLFIREKDIIMELKLNENIYKTNFQFELEMTYTIEQKYLTENGPDVCNLSYETKLALCNLFFKQYKLNEYTNIKLNKPASYIFNMNCVINTVHSNIFDQIGKLLKSQQKMYPCYGQTETAAVKGNLFSDMLHPYDFFISNGPRRNSIFIYSSKKLNDNSDNNNEYKKYYYIVELIENIKFKSLKPIIITLKDIKIESSTMIYTRVKEIIEIARKRYYVDLLNVFIESREDESGKEDDIINEMMNLHNTEKAQIKNQIKLEKSVTQYKSNKSHLPRNIEILDTNKDKVDEKYIKKNNNEKKYKDHEKLKKTEQSSTNELDLDNIEFGSQVYKRFIDEIRVQMKSTHNILNLLDSSYEITTEMKKKLEEKILEMKKMEKLMKKNKKLDNAEVQNLIKNMEIYVQHNNLQMLLMLAQEISSLGNENKDQKKFTKQMKKKKKIN